MLRLEYACILGAYDMGILALSHTVFPRAGDEYSLGVTFWNVVNKERNGS